MKSRARSTRSPLRRTFTSCLLAWLLALGMPVPRGAFAGPDGHKVVRGDVQVEKVGDTTVIHASDQSIIKFKSFDIAPNETVRFVQPSEKSTVLNRIKGSKPTTIEGALIANGRVYLVNRAGVYFAPGAKIDVAEIVAAAGHITNRDFLAGVDRFSDVTGAVKNDGTIDADSVKLVGAHVSNSGEITADGGAIFMVSGDDVLLGQKGSRLYVKIGKMAPADGGAAGIEQSGTLDAAGGQVLLAGGDSLGLAIDHSGSTRAAEIALQGGRRGIVEVGGSLDASDTSEGGKGGRIEVTGERIALRAAELDASGDAGGGEVLVGGDFQGKGNVRTADVTFVDPDTRIAADALSAGDGGKVIVWADYTTGFHGEIGARGGEAGGDGGTVEVSGNEYLFFHGDVDTFAPLGDTGQLLLDPVNLTIANGTGDGQANGTNTFAGDPSGTTGSVLFADTAPTTVFESELEGLAATTNVILQASGNLVMQDLTDNVLALTTGTGNSVAFTGTGSFQMDASDTIRTEGASLNISGGSVTLGNLSTRGASGSAGGATSGIGVAVTGAGNTTLRSIDAGAGAVTLLHSGGSFLDDGSTATRIAGSSLLIGANGAGASLGSALNPIGTNITTTTPGTGSITASATTGSGGIFISELSALVLNNINGGTTKTIGLTSETGSITSVANTLVSGSTLTISANDTNAAIGALAAPIRVNITGPVNAFKTNGTGGIFLTSAFVTGQTASANPLTVGTIDAGTGGVTLTGASVALPATITGLQGSILDDGNTSTRISGATLSMTAAQAGATIGTAATPIGTNLTGALSASTPAGGGGGAGVYVSEQSGLVVGGIGAGTKPVVLTAEAGSITDDGNVATVVVGSTLNLNANAAGAGIGTGAAPIRVTLSNLLNASTPNGTGGIFVTETGGTADPMLLGTIDAGNGAIALTAVNGAIVDDGNLSTFIAGNGLTLTATGTNGAIGSSAQRILVQDVGNLTAAAIGGIFVTQTQGGDLALGNISSIGRNGTTAVAGDPGGITIRNNTGALIVNGTLSTYAGLFNPSGLQAYTLPGAMSLDSQFGIEFNVSSLTSRGNLSLNTNVGDLSQPVLASIFRRPGPGNVAADLTLTSVNGSIDIGAGQVVSVPGILTLNANAGTPNGPNNTPPFIPGSVTVADLNALEIVVHAQEGRVRLREPRSLRQQDGSTVTDGGVDWVANTITIDVGDGLLTDGTGPAATFSTPTGDAVANAPPNSRFGTPFLTTPIVPASFVGTGGAALNRILDFRGTGSTTEGTPDAVAPVPSPIVRDDGQLSQLNAEAAALHPVWGMDLLAYLRCSQAPGDDPDRMPVDCLGYDARQEARAPLSSPEAALARADYRELLRSRDALRGDLQEAYAAYRAQAPDAAPSGADFRRFVEQSPAHADAAQGLRSLRELLDSLDRMLGPEHAPGVFESWQRDLLQDFTPGNMSPELLYEATGAGSGKVQTADRGEQGPTS